jgi:hypothetical protein
MFLDERFDDSIQQLGSARRARRYGLDCWCGRGDSNPHGIATASPSSWCVCQFRHFREEGSEPGSLLLTTSPAPGPVLPEPVSALVLQALLELEQPASSLPVPEPWNPSGAASPPAGRWSAPVRPPLNPGLFGPARPG